MALHALTRQRKEGWLVSEGTKSPAMEEAAAVSYQDMKKLPKVAAEGSSQSSAPVSACNPASAPHPPTRGHDPTPNCAVRPGVDVQDTRSLSWFRTLVWCPVSVELEVARKSHCTYINVVLVDTNRNLVLVISRNVPCVDGSVYSQKFIEEA